MDFLLGVTEKAKKMPVNRRRKKVVAIAQRKRQCGFCQSKEATYTCTNCERHYCSSDCFASDKHRQCSEQFFKKCVFDHMKQTRVDAAEKAKFTEMLQRYSTNQEAQDFLSLLEQTGEEEDCGEYDFDIARDPGLIEFSNRLVEKLNDLNIEEDQDLDKVWLETLGEEDRRRFVELVNDNQKLFDKVIEPWTPWWRDRRWTTTVEDITPVGATSEKEDSREEQLKFPNLYTEIVRIENLTSRAPPPTLFFSLACVTFAYCHLTRIYNGEIVGQRRALGGTAPPDAEESLWNYEIYELLVKYAPVMAKDSKLNFENSDQVMEFCAQNFLSLAQGTSGVVSIQDKIATIELLDDVRELFDFEQKPANTFVVQDGAQDGARILLPKNVVYALSDLIAILEAIELYGALTKPQAKLVALSRKKLAFFLSWLYHYGGADAQLRKSNRCLLNTLQFMIERLKQENSLFEEEETEVYE